VLNGLTRLIAPILSYTAEEMWQFMSHTSCDNAQSVFLNDIPQYKEEYAFTDIANGYNKLFDYRDDVMKALELARAEKLIGKSLDATVTIYAGTSSDAMTLFKQFESELKDIFICSEVILSDEAAPADAFSETESGIAVKVGTADGTKCDRCWFVTKDACSDGDGQNLCARCASIIKAEFPEIE